MNKADMLTKLGIDRLHGWQEVLLDEEKCANRIIRIPTGFGKTLGVLCAWIWNRVVRDDEGWPRRLLWCLPMRVLVEQTEAEVRRVLNDLNLAWNGCAEHSGRVGVHLLMGGMDSGSWHLYPEENAVLVGTQDMLLSRALNRGYGAARARWPMDFGLLNQDALWVMDEVQLMDVGLATSSQLQSFRAGGADEDRSGTALRPCYTWWMSATMQDGWLSSVDTKRMLEALPPRAEIPPAARNGRHWEVEKSCIVEPVGEDKDGKAISELASRTHRERKGLTLVVMNTVDAAVAVHKQLTKALEDSDVDLRLVHSRFRAADRERWREEFLNKTATLPPAGRVVVATQVIEAGVDISATTLITDLSPWPSLVQRFGRCARYPGEKGSVIVVDRQWSEKDEKKALPYEVSQLVEAKEALSGLTDVSPRSLERFEDGLTDDQRLRLYPYRPKFLLLQREWEELFDTSPDLSGADLDVSRFIRTGEENDCLVFWRDIPEGGPDDDWRPARSELCPVPFLKAQAWLCDAKATRVKTKEVKGVGQRSVAWGWDWLDGSWNRRTERRQIIPGAVILVDASVGGYTRQLGWDPSSRAPKQGSLDISPKGMPSLQEKADSAESREDLSHASAWESIAEHCRMVAAEAVRISTALGLPPSIQDRLRTAGLAHDLGKVSPYFQGSIDQEGAPSGLEGQLAKAPPDRWRRDSLYRHDGETRKGFRHELASTLALFDLLRRRAPRHIGLMDGYDAMFDELRDASVAESSVETKPLPSWLALDEISTRREFDLVAYLVASHHGKVRCSLQASPLDQDYRDKDGRGLPIRGVREGDELPSVNDVDGREYMPPVLLTLEPSKLGLSPETGPSWTERVLDLIGIYGPDVLGYLEAILRVADVRVSAGIQHVQQEKAGGER